MIHVEGHPSFSGNNDWRSVFGGGRHNTGGTPGTTANRSNSWLPRAVTIYRFNHIRSTAVGGGNSFSLVLHDGGTTLATLAFDNTDGTQDTLTETDTLTAATSAAISEAHLFSHPQTGGAVAQGTTSLVYQDASNDAVSYYCAGDGTTTVLLANGRFIAPFGTQGTGSTTEASVQMPIPTACTMKYIAVRYTPDDAVTAWELEIRKVATSGAGVSQGTPIPLPTVVGSGITINNTLNISFAVGDLLSFRMVRTAGASTGLQINVVFGLETA